MGSADFRDQFTPGEGGQDPFQGDGLGEVRDLLRRVALKPAREALALRAKRCLRDEAALMDITILAARSAAQLVVAAVGYGRLSWFEGLPIPEPETFAADSYVQDRVLEALHDLQLEDASAHQAGLEQPEPTEPRHLYLEDWFHIDQGSVLGAAVRFNRLNKITRQCFQALFMDRRTIEACTDLQLGPPDFIKAQAEIALRAIMDPESPLPPNFLAGGHPS